jgi:hypothetical protein
MVTHYSIISNQHATLNRCCVPPTLGTQKQQQQPVTLTLIKNNFQTSLKLFDKAFLIEKVRPRTIVYLWIKIELLFTGRHSTILVNKISHLLSRSEP